MKRKKLTFQVTLSVPEQTSSREAARYVRDAVHFDATTCRIVDTDSPFFDLPTPTVVPVKPVALKKDASPIHNPCHLPARKLPKGMRFMTKAEVAARKDEGPSPNIRMWSEMSRKWMKGACGNSHWTYCVPLNFKP